MKGVIHQNIMCLDVPAAAGRLSINVLGDFFRFILQALQLLF